ncbi:MAG: hypothetical protein RSO15_05520, partial [Bacteroides sp.]|uniref:hypothetical protein n=1 Tax=Bacteroides sp. TaxID=29523 RepID=UPI002FC6EC11
SLSMLRFKSGCKGKTLFLNTKTFEKFFCFSFSSRALLLSSLLRKEEKPLRAFKQNVNLSRLSFSC